MSDPSSATLPATGTATRIGSTLGGKYRIVGLLGEGGMGAVYKAEHVVVGRRFAVKFLHAELAKNEAAIQRFRREATLAGAIESEHVAAVTDFDVADDGSPYLVMEHLVGESLSKVLLREGRLPLPRALGVLLQACRGLAAAHAAGVIHRDLKPDNLFVTERSDGSELIKILDFGIARLQSPDTSPELTRSGAAMGTPYYMAPEQARGERSLDHRVDIHALGVILYELLSGQKPHPGDSYNSILAHILTQKPAQLDGVCAGLPAGLADVVHRALAPNADDRQRDVAEFVREISPFLGKEIRLQHSQLELRVAASASAASNPTPAPHTLSQAPETSEKRGTSRANDSDAPASRARTPRPGWMIVAALTLASGIVWFLSAGSERAPAPSEVAVASGERAVGAASVATAASVAAAATSLVPAPASSPTAPALVVAPPAKPAFSQKHGKPAVPANSVRDVPAPSAAPSATKPRQSVNFETRNPYE